MKNNIITVKVASNDKEYLIDLHIPSSYQYKMDQTVLMVGRDFEPTFGKIIGSYFYKIDNYDNINENNYSNGVFSNINIRNFDYKKEYIFGHEFKTYCTEYLDDHTINKTYICKINNEIVGRLEIQKFGAMNASDYSEESVNELLNILVNIEVKNENTNNTSTNANSNFNSDKVTQNTYGDVIIETLKKSGSTSKMSLIFAGLFLLAALIFYIVDKEMVIVSIVFVIWGVIFILLYLGKMLIGKKNLKSINFEEIRSDAFKGCIPFESVKTFFTPNYIISNYFHQFAIKYSDVVWIYPMNKYVNGVKVSSDLILCLINKKKQYLPDRFEFINIIQRNNPNVIIGFNLENRKKYKEIIKRNGQK